jgi:hypothetical protein
MQSCAIFSMFLDAARHIAYQDMPWAIHLQDQDHSHLPSYGPAITTAGMQPINATAAVLQTPLDMESLNHQNQEKLNMLQVCIAWNVWRTGLAYWYDLTCVVCTINMVLHDCNEHAYCVGVMPGACLKT